MANELSIGTRRMGSLIDFDKNTHPVNVVLERDERGISIVVPWPSLDDPYAKWFVRDSHSKVYERKVPKRLLFSDSYGEVMLVDCWPRGYHHNLDSGSGRVWAKYAIIGVDDDIDFLVVHGIRSEVSGLRQWLGVSSLSEDFDRKAGVFTLKAKAAEPVRIGAELTLNPSWKTERAQDDESITVRDIVYCESRMEKPTTWHDSLGMHLGLRDLLMLSRWVEETCEVVSVLRLDDPIRTLDGKTHGEQWRTVIPAEANDSEATKPSGYRPHLIQFDEIGQNGLEKWLQLREEFGRALDPIISDRFLKGVGAVTHMAEVGPGLEALGFLLLLRDGLSEAAAGKASLRRRFERIHEDVSEAIPFDGLDWINGTVSAYNGIKHANRELPTELELLNRWRESLLTVRVWVATELGVNASDILERLRYDPQTSAFVQLN